MRTRWDEVEEVDGGSHRFLGFSAVTWGMAVPVAFIAGAAVMSFFDQSSQDTSPLAITAPVAGESHKASTESRVSADKGRWEDEARQSAAKAAELQMQVEALRDQMSDETRRREQAEQSAAQTATALEKMQQAAASTQARPATAMTVSNPAASSQTPLSYAEPAGSANPAFGTQAGADTSPQQTVSIGANSGSQTDSSNDSIALQRIIEDTASRSAALSDRKDEMEADTTSSVSSQTASAGSRSASEVETALGRATGLDTLSASQRTGLKDDLVGGACVTVSLEKVFGNPVPVVPLRNLVRDLDSDC